jgi:HSP20 family protein
MADITRWDPFAEMAALRHTVDRLFDDVRPWRIVNPGEGADGFFPIDLYETADDVVVRASIPGAAPEDIDISVTGEVLTLKGEVKASHEEEDHNYFRRERRTGTFVRQFSLPSEVDSGRADAVFENGVLTLTLPKAEAVKPKTIKVQAKPMINGSVS